MSVKSTVARTRSSATSACWPVRSSAITWNESRHGSTKWYMLRPGSGTYLAPEMWSATYLPIEGVMKGSSVCWTTSVGTRTVGSSARTSISAVRGIMSARVRGLAASRSIRAHVARISSFQGMSGLIRCFELPGPPHGSHRIDGFLVEPFGASRRVRVALEHNQCGRPGRMCRREQRPCRQRAVDSDENSFTSSEIVEHRGDAVGPLLQRRQRARRDGVGGSRARLVEEDESPQRCHRLDPPCREGNSGRISQHVNQFGMNTMSRGPSRDVR